LSWTLEDHLGSGGTCRLLRETALQLRGGGQEAMVVADAGSENVNAEVDDVLDEEGPRRTLAQVDVTLSNSMIEAFWRSLEHSWLSTCTRSKASNLFVASWVSTYSSATK
jgi:transposase InsO family protein